MSQNIKAPEGANKKRIIQGRGIGARKGRACGRGHDGQNSRSGGGVRPGFEGGQMPLYRRIAARGFSNYPFKKEYEVINLEEINRKYDDGETVDLETLKAKKIIKNRVKFVKVLSQGDLDKKLTVAVAKVSAGAKQKIEKAGGSVAATAVEDEAEEAKDLEKKKGKVEEGSHGE